MASRADLTWIAEILLGGAGRDAYVGASPPRGFRSIFTFGALPSAAKPYVLIPRQPVLAAEAVRELANPVVTSLSVAEGLLALGLRSGIPQRVRPELVHFCLPLDADEPRSPLLAHFQRFFGRDDLSLAVIVGTVRPNRKPVLKVITSDGTCLGFAKVGWNRVTRALLANEADALEAIAGLATPPRSFAAPEVLERREVAGYDVLLLKPLPHSRRGMKKPSRFPVEAAKEIASLRGVESTVLSASAYWAELNARIEAATWDEYGPASGLLARAMELLETKHGTREVAFGTWHGDFIPWNMKRAEGTLYIWDWERSSSSAPVGLDAARYDLDLRMKIKRESPEKAVRASAMSLGPVLEELGAPAGTATLVTTLHALEMVLRFQEARKAGVEGRERRYVAALQEMLVQPLRLGA